MRDFGGIVTAEPVEVVRPSSAAALAAVVRRARRARLPVVARGAGHSAYGQSLAPGGISVDMRGLGGVHEIGPGRVVAGAGASWREVLAATLARGLTPPVLPDFLELTVGGVVSAGGFGGTSFAQGMVTDHVLALELVTPDGRVVHTTSGPLFDAARAGLGRAGIITLVGLRLMPAPTLVRTAKLTFGSVGALVAAQRALAATGDIPDITGQAKLSPTGAWTYELAATWPVHGPVPQLARTSPRTPGAPLAGAAEVVDREYRAFADRMAPDVALLRASGDWARPHPWAVNLLPGARVVEIVEATLARIGPRDLGRSGVVMVNPVGGRTPSFPLPAEPFHFGLLRTADPGGTPVRAALAANRELYERMREAGGRRYPVDAVATGALR